MTSKEQDGYLIDFLKEENARIDYEDKWLVWDFDHWVVYQRPVGARHNKCLYSGDSLNGALESLKWI